MTDTPTLAAMLEWLYNEADRYQKLADNFPDVFPQDFHTQKLKMLKAIRARLVEQDANTLPEIPGWKVSVEARYMCDPFCVRYRATLSRPHWEQWNPTDQDWIDFVEGDLSLTPNAAVLSAAAKIKQTEGV